MKKSSILIRIFLVIIILVICIWGGSYLYTEHYNRKLENIALTRLNKQPNLYASNSKTLKALRKEHISSIQITSDNQGSKNIFYYTAEINHREYGITYVSTKKNNLYLKSITLIK